MGGTEAELRAVLKDEEERTQLLEDEANNSNTELMRKIAGCIAAAMLALIVALSSICVQVLQVGFPVFVFITLCNYSEPWFVIDREALAKQGDNALGRSRGSIRQSVCVFVSALMDVHYQSKIFVCVSKYGGVCG